MRNCFVIVLLSIAAFACKPVRMQQARGPLVMHVWIYYGRDPKDLVQVVDSSRCKYSVEYEKETDGYTRVVFSFRPDPTLRQMDRLITRLKRYNGVRSFVTTRGQQIIK